MPLVQIDRAPPARTVRFFAGLWFPLFFGLVGLQIYRTTGALDVSSAIWGGTLALAAAGLISPRFGRLLFVGLSYATYPLGLVVSYVLLVAVYFLVITPIGLTLRVLGHDALQRRRDPAARTYWSRRVPPDTLARYFRQY